MVNSKSEIWKNFELLGLIDRYENVLASVGYEFIEEHVLATCKGRWEKPMLEELRTWMSENVVPWMLHVYARDASSRTFHILMDKAWIELEHSRGSKSYATRRWLTIRLSH